MIGPGKYDAEAQALIEKLRADGIVLIVLGGPHGSGCSMKVHDSVAGAMPALLRQVADAEAADINKMTGGRLQ